MKPFDKWFKDTYPHRSHLDTIAFTGWAKLEYEIAVLKESAFEGMVKKNHEMQKLREENKRLREAECGTCGKSLPPDGDCYACEVDRIRTEKKYDKKIIDATVQFVKAYRRRQIYGEKPLEVEEIKCRIKDILAAVDKKYKPTHK